jgi:hypothetical protein
MRRLIELVVLVVPAAVLSLIPLILGAQSLPIDSGARVRVVGRVTRGVPLVARLVETRADTLVLNDGAGEPLVLLAGDLERIDVERPNRARSGAMATGMLLGLAGGTAAAVNLCRGHGPDCWFIENDGNSDGDTDDEEDHLLPSVGTLTIGAITLAGGAIGALLTPSKWKRVGGAAMAPVRVGLRGARGARRGLGVVVSIPFGGPTRAGDGTERAR